jgi:hypothetical protein
MACTVLAFVRLWATALVLVVAPLAGLVSAAQQKDCSTKHPGGIPAIAEPEVRNLQEHLKAGPFYRELLLQFGKPLSCNLEFDDGMIGLTYAFRGRVQLIARIDRKIELSEQRVQIPRMELTKAIALLKAAERDAYRPNGCGITWDHPEEESSGGPAGSREAVYRGATCNCQARVTSRNNYAVSLVLKSAC